MASCNAPPHKRLLRIDPKKTTLKTAVTRGRGKGLKRDRGTLSLSFPEMGGGELSSWGGELNTGLTVLVNPQADRLNCWRYSFCHMQSVICNLILAALSLLVTNDIRRSATI